MKVTLRALVEVALRACMNVTLRALVKVALRASTFVANPVACWLGWHIVNEPPTWMIHIAVVFEAVIL